jgi:SNF2 family DNA or RNA helicase/HJR/Mrr/RecB family endonuclease
MNFDYQIKETGIELYLLENNKPLETHKWRNLKFINQIEAISLIENATHQDDDSVIKTSNNNGYLLSFSFVSELQDQQAKGLSLPQTLPYKIKINTQDNVGSSSYKVWISVYDNSNKQKRYKREGCFIKIGSTYYRLPKTFYKIFEEIDKHDRDITTNVLDKNTNFLSVIKTLLPDGNDANVSIEDSISNITLQHASAFSVKIKGNINSPVINPVLFNKNIKDRAISGEEEIEEDEHILNENDSLTFIGNFIKQSEVKRSYVLGKNNYIFIDPSLRDALSVVHKIVKSGNIKEKQAFIKNPQTFIKDALEDENESNDITTESKRSEIDSLFIETRQFSARVKELGIWKAPELPFLAKEANEWSSDSFHFEVQDKIISFPKEDLEKVINEIEDNIRNSVGETTINGTSILTDPEFLRVLQDFSPYRPDPPDNGEEGGEASEDKPEGPMVLLTQENFDEVNFKLSLKPREKQISNQNTDFLNPQITLKQHQIEGLNWLVKSYNVALPGVLMADDMGLGKTLQALSFLALLKRENIIKERKPILIVAPVSLLKNWEDEHNKHLNDEGLGLLCKLFGNHLKEYKTIKSNDVKEGFATLETEKLFVFDWFLTTYETLRDYQTSFAEINFSCIIFDEIQKAKNPRSLLTHATKVINSEFSVGLTGTPVENSIADLWTILDILSPSRLNYDLKSFLETYPEDNIDKLKNLSDLLLKSSNGLPSFILRRMKDEVVKDTLPTKTIVNSSETTLKMEPLQSKAYLNAHSNLKAKELTTIQAIHQFRTISLHPAPEQANELNIDNFINSSARMKVTFQELDKIKVKNEKVLIFLERRSMQPVIAGIIREKYKLEFTPMIINGAVSGLARQNMVDKFQGSKVGFDVMILSPKAGGVGLTLTAANNVIHLERWWNPAVEDQCTDRVYRIGQTKPVKVITPLSKNEVLMERSFDIVLDNLLTRKRAISKGVFIPTLVNPKDFSDDLLGTPKTSMSIDDVDNLEPLNFEKYVKSELDNMTNLQTRFTQRSYDYGADLIVINTINNKSAILQCKHRSDKSRSVSDDACNEVLNATRNYDLTNPKLYLISNSQNPTSSCLQKANQNNINLIFREKLLDVGDIISAELN